MKNFCYLSPKVTSGIDRCKTCTSPKGGVRTKVETLPVMLQRAKGTRASASPGVQSPSPGAAEKSPPAAATPSAGAEPGSAPTNVLPPRQELPLQLPPPNSFRRRPPASPHLSIHIFSVHDARVDLQNLLKGQRERSWCATIT